MSTLINVNQTLTMSTLEIAELTGKNHKDVLRDVRSMLESLNIDERSFASVYKGGNGQDRPIINLPYRETQILVTGYSIPHRAKVIDRWLELEKESKAQFPTNYIDALEHYVRSEKQRVQLEWNNQSLLDRNQELHKTKAQISDKKTATALGKLGGVTAQANRLRKRNNHLTIENIILKTELDFKKD